MALLEGALWTIFVAASSVGTVVALRKAPFVSRWDEDGVKPWACDLCMSFWVTLFYAGVMACSWAPIRIELLATWMPAFAVAFTWLQRVSPVPPEGDFAGLPDEPPIDPPSGQP